MTWVKHPKDFWAGVLFFSFGLAAVLIASDYSIGTASRMGPGYFPRALGLILIVLGSILAVRALKLRGAPIVFGDLKPLVIILASVVLFGLVAPKLGLVVATIVLIVTSSFASDEFRFREAVISSLALAVFTVLAFGYGLKLQLPIWPVMFS